MSDDLYTNVLTEEYDDSIRDAKSTAELSDIMARLGQRVSTLSKEITRVSWDEAACVLQHTSDLYEKASKVWDVLIKEEEEDVGVIELDSPPAINEFQVCFEVVVAEYNGREFRVGDRVRFGEQEFDLVGVVLITPKQLLFAVKIKTREDVEELMEKWKADPTWDIEETEGFEDFRKELTEFRESWESNPSNHGCFPPSK